jgi:hypothetical protein
LVPEHSHDHPGNADLPFEGQASGIRPDLRPFLPICV